MRHKYKKPNCPRVQSAINRVLTSICPAELTVDYIGRCRIVFMPYSSRDIGVYVLILAYGADKYDVLNKLRSGHRDRIATFIRGDIRHRREQTDYLLLLAFAMVVILILFEIANFTVVLTCFQ